MKATYFSFFAVFLICFAACTPTAAPTDSLTLTKEKICLQAGGKEQCLDGPGTYRLRLQDGKPVLEAMNLKEAGSNITFTQFGRPDAVKAEKLGVIIENKVLSLKDGERLLKDTTGLGFLIVREANGSLSVSTGNQIELESLPIDLSFAQRTVRVDVSSRKLDPSFIALTQIDYTFQGENRYMPNDTGTIVVIIDNFKVVGNCAAEAPDSCCPASEAPGPDVTVTDGMVSDYAADGLRLLACFPNNSICTFTHGDKLIILDCASQERYCIDLSICSVTITTTDDNGICISVPSDCSLENPFE
ncbi:MAG: hypothetical protein IPN95_31845 [Bacteroidetes bacterium]|nr:hypothetical protein [Bacteroidota bacterium]MBP6721819.1 hypothetical protein [Bacteroidia bacterium]